MRIKFKLYATLTDLLPSGAIDNAVNIDLPDDITLHAVIDKYNIPRKLAHLVLLNGIFICAADRDQTGLLADGDTLAIWPPVAGG